MAFLDDLAKKIGDVADMAVDKAKDLTEIGRLNMVISSEEKLVQGWYAEIGKAIYQQDKDDLDSPFVAQCVKIQASLEKIADLQMQLDNVRENGYIDDVIDVEPKADNLDDVFNQCKCPACGQEMPAESTFCSKCGAKIGEEA